MGSIAGYLAWVPPVRREPASQTRMSCGEAMIVRMPNKAAIAEKPFILSGIDIGDAIVRDSSNRPLSMSGRTCPPGPVPFNLLPQKLRALRLQSNTSRRTKETL
jgi:hypothetical protein